MNTTCAIHGDDTSPDANGNRRCVSCDRAAHARVGHLVARLAAAHSVIRRVRDGWAEMDEWDWSDEEETEIASALTRAEVG